MVNQAAVEWDFELSAHKSVHLPRRSSEVRRGVGVGEVGSSVGEEDGAGDLSCLLSPVSDEAQDVSVSSRRCIRDAAQCINYDTLSRLGNNAEAI